MTQEKNIYEEIRDDLEEYGIDRPNGHKEILGYSIVDNYLNAYELQAAKRRFKGLYEGDWDHKIMMEVEHYKKLEGGLLHAMNETKYYVKDQLLESRRFVVTSTDCISTIQIIFRNDEIFVGVYFRSSHAKNLLPVDLDFIYGLIRKTLDHLKYRENTEDYREVTPEVVHKMNNIPIRIKLDFGSLHTY